MCVLADSSSRKASRYSFSLILTTSQPAGSLTSYCASLSLKRTDPSSRLYNKLLDGPNTSGVDVAVRVEVEVGVEVKVKVDVGVDMDVAVEAEVGVGVAVIMITESVAGPGMDCSVWAMAAETVPATIVSMAPASTVSVGMGVDVEEVESPGTTHARTMVKKIGAMKKDRLIFIVFLLGT